MPKAGPVATPEAVAVVVVVAVVVAVVLGEQRLPMVRAPCRYHRRQAASPNRLGRTISGMPR